MKKLVYSTLLSTTLVAAMSTQVFATTPVPVSQPITTTSSTSVTATTPTFNFAEIVEIEPKSFTGITPKEAYEVRYNDLGGNSTLVKTILVFDQNEYKSDTKVARPTPTLTIGDDVFVNMDVENPYEADTRDYKLFDSISNSYTYYLENEITDYTQINQVFDDLFGFEFDDEFLSQFIFVQDLQTDKMTTFKFDMYAPANADKTVYDVLGKFTVDLKGDSTVKVPMKQDVALDPTFAFQQKLLLNHELVSETAVINNDEIFLPVRTFADLTNYNVKYDSKTDSVTLSRGNVKYTAKYGSTTVVKNDGTTSTTYTIDNPLYKVNGVGYVPVDLILNGINN